MQGHVWPESTRRQAEGRQRRDEHLANQGRSCVALGCSPENSYKATRTEFLAPPSGKGVPERHKQQQAFQFPVGNLVAKATFKY